MERRLFIIITLFIIFMISTFNVLICHAAMNDIDNGKLRVQYDKVHTLDDLSTNEKRQKYYDQIVPLSDADAHEMLRDEIDFDYENIDIYDNDFSDCDYFDINGFVNGEWRSTTYEDLGYFAVLKVNDYAPKLLKYNNYVINTIQCDVETEFVHDGNFVKVEYILKNVGDEDATISLGTYADVQIGDNDCATIERIGDSIGVKMYDEADDLQFTFYGKGMEYVTDIDRLWLGLYPEEEWHFFNQNNLNKIEKNDTSFTFSWIDRLIPVGETRKYSVLIGLSKLTSIPVIKFDPEQSDNFTKSNVKIDTIVTDSDEDSEAEVYYVIDDSEEQRKIDFKKLENGTANFEIDLIADNLESGKHHIKAWARDNQGNMSNVIEKDFYISSLNKPIIEMNEEWSKETITFKVTDSLNNQEDVSKYYYRINDEEWKEVELNKDTVALDNTGTASVEAKVVGIKEVDYAISDSKIAKVDKLAPINNKVNIDNLIPTFSATDDHSGLKGFWYSITEDSTPQSGLDKYIQYIPGTQIPNVDSKKDVYLHYISADNVDNYAVNKVFIPYPQKVEIEVEKEFKDSTPHFKFTDKQEKGDFPFSYEVQINEGNIGDASQDKNYDVTNPLIGKNTIKVVKKDVLGRVGEVSVAEFNYKETASNVETKEEQPAKQNTTQPTNQIPKQQTTEQVIKQTDKSSEQIQNNNTQERSNVQNNAETPNISKTQNDTQTTSTTDGTKTYFVAANDDTTAKKSLPKAGKKKIIISLIIGFMCVAFYSLMKYKKY